MKCALLLCFIFWMGTAALAQSAEETARILRNFDNNEDLNAYLHQYDLAPQDTGFRFDASSIEVDIFRKNLFGSKEPETVMQVRDGQAFSINIFYKENGQPRKVPGQISLRFEKGISYYDQRFIFFFEEIFAPGEFSIVTKHNWGYNRTQAEVFEVFKIREGRIERVHSFEGDYYSYSGVFTYHYKKEAKIAFELLDGTYPKSLVRKVTFSNEEVKDRMEVGDILSGIIEEGTYTEITSLDFDSLHTFRAREDVDFRIFINRFNDFDKLEPRDSCPGRRTYFITEDFFQTYLVSKDSTPEMSTLTSEEGSVYGERSLLYLKACYAFIQNRQLHILSGKGESGKFSKSVYPLRPPLFDFLKPEVDAKRLYCFSHGYSKGELKYFEKDTVIRQRSYLNPVVRFSDPALLWGEVIEHRECGPTLRLEGMSEPVYIALSDLSPFLKAEVLQSLKKIKV